jgi:predicted PurR-regulated permease PerM
MDELLLDKNQVIESLSQLPDKVSSEELIERILFIKLIQSRLQEKEQVSHEQVMQELRELKQQKVAESIRRNG